MGEERGELGGTAELLLRAMSAHNRVDNKKEQLWNMDETDFIQKQNSHKVVLSKDSSNVWSKCADVNFYMTFVVCVSTAKYVAPPLLILPGKRLNRDVTEGCDIEGANITTAPKGFINSTLSLSWLEFFVNCVPDSVAHPLVLVYDGCCSHYNDKIAKKQLILKSYWFYYQLMPPI